MSNSLKKFHLEVGKETLIAQGDYKSSDMWKAWGYMQFPNIAHTADNDIYISWALRPDTIDSYKDECHGYAKSDDNGETWYTPTEPIVSRRGVMMSNGKIYQGFFSGGVVVSPYFDNYTPVCDIPRRKVKVYRGDEIKEFVDDSKAIFFDPATKTVEYVPAKVNWPNKPLQVFSGNRLFPISMKFAYLNNIGITVSGDSLYHCIYSYGLDSKTGEVTKHPDCFSVYVFRSDDFGLTWNYVSQLNPIEEIYSATDNDCEGWGEPALTVMPDGSFVIILRSGSGKPSYIARSEDECKTWSTPVRFDKVGVYPHLLRLGCGVTVASYGRPGVFVRATSDPSGKEWNDPVEIELSPCPFENPFLHDTCAYTDMVALDDYTFLLAYSDFNYPNENGEGRKAIVVRKIAVVPEA